MRIKILSALLILTGILIICFPKLSEMYHDYQQQQLIREWQATMQNISNGEDSSTTSHESAPDVLEVDDADEEMAEADDSAEMEKEKPDFSSYQNMEGILTIDKIDLLLPILHGATDKNMKTTVASIENTGKPGEIGNYAIAGHRNFTYGRNFNRLDELEEGDTIEVDDGNRQYEYVVSEKLYVKPEEVWVLEGNGQDKEITLITCHPMVDPTHRLIVKGKIRD